MTKYNTEDRSPKNGDILAGWTVFTVLVGILAITTS